jgi:hypothetical protein
MTDRDRLIGQMIETARAIQAEGLWYDKKYKRAWKLAEAVIMLLDETSRSHLTSCGHNPDSYTIPSRYRKVTTARKTCNHCGEDLKSGEHDLCAECEDKFDEEMAKD